MFAARLALLELLIHCWLVGTVVESQACSEKPWEAVHRRLATKTPYRHVLRDCATEPIDLEGCRITKTWGLFRHGTRNPSRKVIEGMNSDLVGIRDDILQHGRLCRKELELFERWKPMLKPDQEKLLVEEGADEMQQIGRRFRQRFGSALPMHYQRDDFYFKFTKTERAENSARNFSFGLFDRIEDIVFPEPLSKDPVLRFYKLCERWKQNIKHNPEAVREVDLFYNSKPMKEVIGRISRKVGTYVDADSIHLMYQTCAFETAWRKRYVSPWCLLFDKASVKVLEFGEDLEYYWIDGYGYDLTYKQACAAFGDFFHRFDEDLEPYTFYFTHSGTLLKAMAFLGLFHDDYQLTHKDFERRRHWRVSEIDAFATNLVFTKLECTNGTHVMLTHQECPVTIPGCPQKQALCDYDTVKRIFNERIENCAFEPMCSLNVPINDEL
ncbi:multiple inositol polyphosphate phosphatase 1 [Topomyia yanbarensis]|uniref:multiple inositol polyphosphate phosphatase 1 n=1 Tax=Topomyia yanbarensis TaxID=2498891 RepID=UPI00273B6A93|nr:multiple inositol polyphosphate phosphatase 1 [Topomyia yanbarensis]XP_058830424.1 multiple inositol polyphosphate phosphatase 1 [Topomyia yanbarensis]